MQDPSLFTPTVASSYSTFRSSQSSVSMQQTQPSQSFQGRGISDSPGQESYRRLTLEAGYENALQKPRAFGMPGVTMSTMPTMPGWGLSVTDEARNFELNPDAPEFAPVHENDPRLKTSIAPNGSTTATSVGGMTYGQLAPQDIWEVQASDFADAATDKKQRPRLQPVNLNLDRKRRDSLTADSSVQPSPQSAYAIPHTLVPRSTGAPLSLPAASAAQFQTYATPNPSPVRRNSLYGGTPNLPPTSFSASQPEPAVSRDSLVMRTKALLEHQMRTNLAFAEAVAAEYGRELTLRLEAQKRNFAAEHNRRLQLMESAVRKRVFEAEESLRRQYEEKYALRPPEQASDFSGGSASAMRRVQELMREVAILRTELNLQHRSSHSVQQESTRSRMLMEPSTEMATLNEGMLEPEALMSKSREELIHLVWRLNQERGHLVAEASSLTRRVAELEGLKENRSQSSDLRDGTESWAEELQREVSTLDKNLIWSGRETADPAMQDHISNILSELERQASRLRTMLDGDRGTSSKGMTSHGNQNILDKWDSGVLVANNTSKRPSVVDSPETQESKGLNPADSDQGVYDASWMQTGRADDTAFDAQHTESNGYKTLNQAAPDPWDYNPGFSSDDAGEYSADIVQQMYACALGVEEPQDEKAKSLGQGHAFADGKDGEETRSNVTVPGCN
ncbi:hypothetical protein HDU85_005144 [Gaertneriomyces sp. JEL0708]|nr:hypothetical protein HDU85_005144 [Gaertneriomyces sp. JEL0708]